MKKVRRQEYKYMISYVEYFKIIDSIKTMLYHDRHGESSSYPVNSIYLDDIYFSGAQDKAFGNEFHRKYRIRYYHDANNKKLELKEKVGNDSTKYSTQLNNELFEAIINQDFDVLEKHFEDPLIRRFGLDLMRNHFEPKCNILYQREAFRDETDNLRLTFDHSLSISRFHQEIDSESIKLLKDTHLIMEIKYEHFVPKEIKAIIKSISADQIAYSKYFLGYEQITL